MSRRVLIAMTLFGAAVAGTGAAQARPAARGAVWGGVIGGAVTGLLGGLVTQAVCDAADCSGAWVDGSVPGVVLGGLGGAALGAAVGAAVGRSRPAGDRSEGNWTVTGRASAGAARAESESIKQGVGGGRVLVGVGRRGFSVGPEVEWIGRAGWRVANATLAAQIGKASGTIRPFGQVGLGVFDWRHPGVVPDQCVPGVPPQCTYRQGTITDRYAGAALAVGTSIGDRRSRWAATVEIRYHWSGNRPKEEGSTVTRQLRQLNLGLEARLGR